MRDIESFAVANRCADLPQVLEVDCDGAHGGRLRNDVGFLVEPVREGGACVPEMQVVPGQSGGLETGLTNENIHL